MTNDNNLAKRTDVPLGELIIEGYLLPEKFWTKTNKFGVSKTQAVMLAYPDYERSQAAKRYIEIAKSKQAQIIAPQGFTVYPKVEVDSQKERVDLIPVDELPLFLQVCRIAHKGKRKNTPIERTYRDRLNETLGGQTEVLTLAGKIDILTQLEIIEVKPIELWKDSLGQVLAYGYFYPSHQKRIHLYGETQQSFLDMVQAVASTYSVQVSWEP